VAEEIAGVASVFATKERYRTFDVSNLPYNLMRFNWFQNENETFSGKYCECSNFNCPRRDRVLCSGLWMDFSTPGLL